MATITTVGVYCGASLGNNQIYRQATLAFAQALVEMNYTLVYGGSRTGLMGLLANHILAHHGKVIGVITTDLIETETRHTGLTSSHITHSIQERKSKIQALSDALVMLPGGLGTLDEFFETLNSTQLGYHNKPCAILNVQGYFDQLLHFLKYATTSSFIPPCPINRLIIENNPKQLLNKLLTYDPSIPE